jgi:molecular chaperone DnaJ
MARDYYIVLGINRGADLKKIKSAYRRIAKKFHPDISKSENDLEAFLEAKAAYETLSDEEKRKQYNYELEHQVMFPVVKSQRIVDIVEQRRSKHEYLNNFLSSIDEFFSGFVPGIFSTGLNGEKDLYIDLILTAEEASKGGVFPISVPVIENCHYCQGEGMWDQFYCPYCKGYGKMRGQRELGLAVPANVTHGLEVELPLEDIGLRGIMMNIRILIKKFP